MKKSVHYQNTTIEKLIEETPDQKFDLVCCSEVIEHVSNQKEFLQSCLRKVKPDGLFFLSTIAKTYEGYFTNILMGEYVLGLLPKGTHEYDLFISHDTVMEHIRDKFSLVEAKGVTVKNPITFEMTETNYLRANYMMMCKARQDL